MIRRAWLTQDTIPDRVTVAIQLPDSENWRAQFLGAFLLLTEEQNWEEYGTLDPEEMAAEWLEIFTQFTGGETTMWPIGTITQYAGIVQPEGWFFCNGGEVGREDYPELFNVIGETYGVGDGSTTFNIPDLRQRVAVGLDEEDLDYDNIGTEGGAETVTLTVSQMPSHNHDQNSHNHTQNAHNHTQNAHSHAAENFGLDDDLNTGVSGFTSAANLRAVVENVAATAVNQAATAVNQAATAVNQATGGGTSHNNMQPYIVLNFIIKH